MFKATRFALQRLAMLDQAIRAGELPNAATLARKREVSPRTIRRDVESLRDRLKAPLDFDARRNGYVYTEPDFRKRHGIPSPRAPALSIERQVNGYWATRPPLSPSPAVPIDKTGPQQDRVRGRPGPVASRQSPDMTLDGFDRDRREREGQAEGRRDRACTRPARAKSNTPEAKATFANQDGSWRDRAT